MSKERGEWIELFRRDKAGKTGSKKGSRVNGKSVSHSGACTRFRHGRVDI